MSLLDAFSSLDQAQKDTLADIDSPRLLAFTALYIAKKYFSIDSLSAEHIVACLEAAGIAVTKKSIGRSLSGAKGFVTRSINDDYGDVFYKLMIKGEREAENQLDKGRGLVVLKIEGEKPRQARLKLGEIIKHIEGTVRICDPFYGVGTFDSLDLFSKKCDIKFLTQKISDSVRKTEGALRDFLKERPNTEFKLAPASSRLHDRYIITEDQILILGHGVKDIGNKESFIIMLDKKLVPDLINEVINSFDKEWNLSTKI